MELISTLNESSKSEPITNVSIKKEPVSTKRSDNLQEDLNISSLSPGKRSASLKYEPHMDKEERDSFIPHVDDFMDDESDQATGNQRSMWLVGAAFIVVSACVWRFIYFENPANQSLLISSGLTLILFTVVLFFKKRDADHQVTEDSLLEISEPFEENSSSKRFKKGWNHEQEQLVDTTDSLGSYSLPPRNSQSHTSSEGAMLPTTYLGSGMLEENSTALLGSADSEKTWLKRVWKGQEEEITIALESFKIGRAAEGVSYAESADGVSRVHLEIERIDGEHHAKDLGSRNGSLLNGNLMVPYKAYKLMTGDTIHLAGMKGPVYELHRG